MSKKLYIVELTAEERSKLNSLVSKGKASAYKRLHAQILLKSDVGPNGPGWADVKIAEALDIVESTIRRIRKRFVEQGLESALNRKEQKNRRAPIIDGKTEAFLIATACSEAPEGHQRWTIRLLANRLVELEHIDSVSRETVRRKLKKTKLNRG